MKIHYFQRYHGKENVATANTMLLLSRLYQYSSDKFFAVLRTLLGEEVDLEISFGLQERSNESVPDAVISQNSFKVLVETKTSDWFYSDQLIRHLSSFGDEQLKVLITLAPVAMEETKLQQFETELADYNTAHSTHIRHVNTTFLEIIDAIQAEVLERDYEMQDVLDDYLAYCNHDHLLENSSSEYILRVQLAGTTFKYNLEAGLYYDNANRGFRPHDYLGLYTRKSVRAIGRIESIIVSEKKDGDISFKIEKGSLTEQKKESIRLAIEHSMDEYGYDLSDPHRFFFVEKFYETDFRKTSPRAPMGSRVFNLSEIFEGEKFPSDVSELAEALKSRTWQ